jgi:hypothetical protein
MRDKYNGWTNRETWAVYLYIGNEETLYNKWRERALVHTRANHPAWMLGQELRDDFERLQESILTARGDVQRDLFLMFADIGSLWRVDWDAVAKTLME